MVMYKKSLRSFRKMEDQSMLAVDDVAQMRDMLRVMLRNNGCIHLSMVESGKQPLKQISLKHADLVITDWNMPNMSGIELLKHIKGDPIPGRGLIIFSCFQGRNLP